jgi:signal transduction histidine kinase
MANVNRLLSLREAIDSLLAPEVTGPLDELADALVVASGTLGRLRRAVESDGPRSAELAALDASFSRSIVLTRELRERLQARRSRGDYTSVSHVAREVVGRLQGAIPDEVSLLVKCPDGPAIVAADRADLRRVMTGLLESGIEASAGNGRLDLEVSEPAGGPGERQRRIVQIEVRCSAGIEEQDTRIAAVVRPVVRSIGGALTFRAPIRGGTAIAVRLPSAC